MSSPIESIQSLLDRESIGGRQWLVFILCFVIAGVDGVDTQCVAYTGPAIAKAFGMGAADISYIFAGTLGMAIGAILML